MRRFPPDEVLRVARLCRLRLGPEEAARFSAELEAITDAFSDLADHAAGLPGPPEPAPLAPRDDPAPRPASPDEVEAILRASPRADPATGLLRGPKGLP